MPISNQPAHNASIANQAGDDAAGRPVPHGMVRERIVYRIRRYSIVEPVGPLPVLLVQHQPSANVQAYHGPSADMIGFAPVIMPNPNPPYPNMPGYASGLYVPDYSPPGYNIPAHQWASLNIPGNPMLNLAPNRAGNSIPYPSRLINPQAGTQRRAFEIENDMARISQHAQVGVSARNAPRNIEMRVARAQSQIAFNMVGMPEGSGVSLAHVGDSGMMQHALCSPNTPITLQTRDGKVRSELTLCIAWKAYPQVDYTKKILLVKGPEPTDQGNQVTQDGGFITRLELAQSVAAAYREFYQECQNYAPTPGYENRAFGANGVDLESLYLLVVRNVGNDCFASVMYHRHSSVGLYSDAGLQ